MLDLKGNIITYVHKICTSNYAKDKYITVVPKLKWTDNIQFAYCFETELEAMLFCEKTPVQELIEVELELLNWTDTRQSVYE
jgi:hypothetical protein